MDIGAAPVEHGPVRAVDMIAVGVEPAVRGRVARAALAAHGPKKPSLFLTPASTPESPDSLCLQVNKGN